MKGTERTLCSKVWLSHEDAPLTEDGEDFKLRGERRVYSDHTLIFNLKPI